MRLLPACIALLAASATIPALGQSTSRPNPATNSATATSAAPAQPGTTSAAPPAEAAPVSASALRADMQQQDQLIKKQIETQETIRRVNKDLMKKAEKLDEKNKKLEKKNKKLEAKQQAFNAEKNNVDAQNADLARKNDAVKAAEKPIQTVN